MFDALFKKRNSTPAVCLCPHCSEPLSSIDVNVGADTALCPHCGTGARFSELIHSGGYQAFDTSHPPAGAAFEVTPGGFVASATTRSWAALFLVPFVPIWYGGSFKIYGILVRTGDFNLGTLIFGIWFLLVTFIVHAQAIMSFCGKVKIVRDGDQGTVFQGVGSFGWTRRFRWVDVEAIAEGRGARGRRGGPPPRLIELHFKAPARAPLPFQDPPVVKFGTLLSNERRWFLISALRSQIVNR